MQEEEMEAAIVPRDTSTDCHRLKSITLEITDEAVTEGKVEQVLGWTGSNEQIDEAWFSVGTEKRRLFRGLREPLRMHP